MWWFYDRRWLDLAREYTKRAVACLKAAEGADTMTPSEADKPTKPGINPSDFEKMLDAILKAQAWTRERPTAILGEGFYWMIERNKESGCRKVTMIEHGSKCWWEIGSDCPVHWTEDCEYWFAGPVSPPPLPKEEPL